MTKKAFNLSAFDEAIERQEEGTPVVIKGMDGKPTEFIVVVAGPDSRRYLDARNKIAEQAAIAGALTASADAERRGILLVAHAIIGWTDLEIGGKPIPYTVENAVTVCTKYRFVHVQLEAALHDRSRFING